MNVVGLVVLSLYSLFFMLVCYVAWKKAVDISVIIFHIVVYYWTFFGFWGVYLYEVGFLTEKPYMFVEDILFPVDDQDILLRSLMLYMVFVTSIQIALIVILGKKQNHLAQYGALAVVRPSRLLLLSIGCYVASFYIVKDVVVEAFIQSESVYVYLRSNWNSIFVIHQLLNRAGLWFVFISILATLSERNGRYIICKERSGTGLMFVFIVACFSLSYMFVLGNKNELLFFALLFPMAMYSNKGQLPKFKRLIVGGVLAMVVFGVFNFMRGMSLLEISQNNFDFQWSKVFLFPLYSGEAYAANFSMFGAMNFGVDCGPLWSARALFESVLPSWIFDERYPPVYQCYADQTEISRNFSSGQGATLHHATAWFLNFGILGLILGGVAWVLLIKIVEMLSERLIKSNPLYYLLRYAPIAASPVFVREGPVIYKGYLIVSVLLPIFCVALISYFGAHQEKRR